MIKQRKESIAMYEKGERADLAEQEKEEIKIIQRFLPPQMTEDEFNQAISEAIFAVNAERIRDMGKVVNHMKEQYNGRLDLSFASQKIKEKFS